MKNTNVAEDEKFVMEEYTEFLKEYLGERRNITKKVFKKAGQIYKIIQKGATDEQIDVYIDMLEKAKKTNCF